MEVVSNDQMLASFRMLDKKFRRACHHIRVLNRHIEDIQIRYDRAFASGRRSFRYTHRLKLATFEGMRNMYYEYACRRADELEKMQDCLIQRGMISDSESESDADMEYWFQYSLKTALFGAFTYNEKFYSILSLVIRVIVRLFSAYLILINEFHSNTSSAF